MVCAVWMLAYNLSSSTTSSLCILLKNLHLTTFINNRQGRVMSHGTLWAIEIPISMENSDHHFLKCSHKSFWGCSSMGWIGLGYMGLHCLELRHKKKTSTKKSQWRISWKESKIQHPLSPGRWLFLSFLACLSSPVFLLYLWNN